MTKEQLLKVPEIKSYVAKRSGAMIRHTVVARIGGMQRRFGIESWPKENEQNEARTHLKEVVEEETRRVRKEILRKERNKKQRWSTT